MADKTETVLTTDEKIVHAKELYGRGSRNYLVKEYAEAADDLSEVCALYAEIYGDNADELGMPYLLYAKSLIALAQGGENKLLEVPDEEADDEDDDEEEEEQKETKDEAGGSGTKPATNGTNGKPIDAGEGSSGVVEEAVGSSDAAAAATATTDDTDAATEEDDDSPAANLQVAWEVLELAVNIFLRQGDTCAANLADAYFELAEISLENSHFETALRDYSKLFPKPIQLLTFYYISISFLLENAIDIRMKLPEDDLRLIAELQYKIGLSHLMISSFEESIVAFRKACEVLDAEMTTQRSQTENTEKAAILVLELEELKSEIMNKITEVEETKQQVNYKKRFFCFYLLFNIYFCL